MANGTPPQGNFYDRLKGIAISKYGAELAFLMAAGTVITAKLAGEIPTWRSAAFYLFVTAGGGKIAFTQRANARMMLDVQASKVVANPTIDTDAVKALAPPPFARALVDAQQAQAANVETARATGDTPIPPKGGQ